MDEEVADAPGYYAAVRHPMDFASMRAVLQRDHHVTWRAFLEEFELICHNAVGFNRKGSRIHRAALQLLRAGRRYLQSKVRERSLFRHRPVTSGVHAAALTCAQQGHARQWAMHPSAALQQPQQRAGADRGCMWWCTAGAGGAAHAAHVLLLR